jgi:very-short-patch-repair endonuclease
MHPDRALDEFAARQYGAFSLSQARSVGFTPKMIETRRTNGAWIRMAQSVYALGSAPPKWERQVSAALLARRGSIVAGRSAAFLHDWAGFRPVRPVIMVGPTTNARSPLARVIRSGHFNDVPWVRRRGFPDTDEVETIVTMARELPIDQLERIMDNALARGSIAVREVADRIERRGGAPGLGKLRPIVDERREDAYQPPTSELERFLYQLVDNPAIPASTRQMPFRFETVDACVDLYIPAWRLIVEADGRRWHTRKADMELDRRRDNEATAHGLAVLRFTWKTLTMEPNGCLETLIRTGKVRSVS